MLVDVTAYLKEQARCAIDTENGTCSRSQAHHGLLPHHHTRPHHRTGAIAGRQLRLADYPGGPFLQRPSGHVALAGAITARERLPSRE
jgi:hypothetical protein